MDHVLFDSYDTNIAYLTPKICYKYYWRCHITELCLKKDTYNTWNSEDQDQNATLCIFIHQIIVTRIYRSWKVGQDDRRMKANPTGYLHVWSKYKSFLPNGCQNMDLWKTFMGTHTGMLATWVTPIFAIWAIKLKLHNQKYITVTDIWHALLIRIYLIHQIKYNLCFKIVSVQ